MKLTQPKLFIDDICRLTEKGKCLTEQRATSREDHRR